MKAKDKGVNVQTFAKYTHMQVAYACLLYTSLPAWLMALIFNAFFLLYDGWSSLVALVYANHIRQHLL